jgi:hypothetical protein
MAATYPAGATGVQESHVVEVGAPVSCLQFFSLATTT